MSVGGVASAQSSPDGNMTSSATLDYTRQIEFSRFGDLAFPVSGDPAVMWWEPRHWDGSAAVDIRLNPIFGPDSPERRDFRTAGVVAVTGGRAVRVDNPRGGVALIIFGDDGRTYYYAHLAWANVNEARTVTTGEILGQIGATGTWTTYLEPHLHFSVVSTIVSGLDWVADIDAASWIHRNFAHAAADILTDSYPGDRATGGPFFGDYLVTKSFADARMEESARAGATLESVSAGIVPIRAPLTGEVRVHIATALGTRIQITNRVTSQSVIISGDISPAVSHGEIVYKDMIVGSAEGPLHYMLFEGGSPVESLILR
jgi:hypothetical protein